MSKTRFTVVGAGNGGKTMAAHLALMGFPVTLYNRTPGNVAAINTRGGIELIGHDANAFTGHVMDLTRRVDSSLADRPPEAAAEALTGVLLCGRRRRGRREAPVRAWQAGGHRWGRAWRL